MFYIWKEKSLIYIPSNLFLFIENVPVITISDLKSIINDPNGTNERMEKVKNLEKKLMILLKRVIGL